MFKAEEGIGYWSVTEVQTCTFLFQAEGGIRDWSVTGVQTCALLFSSRRRHTRLVSDWSSDVCSSDLLAEREKEGRPYPEWKDSTPDSSRKFTTPWRAWMCSGIPPARRVLAPR